MLLMILLLIVTVPAVLLMPRNEDPEAVVLAEALRIVLLAIDTVPDDPLRMPVNVPVPEALANEVPTFERLPLASVK